MINLTDYIKCYEEILDEKTCTNIVNDISIDNFKKALTGDDDESSFRNCYTNKLNSKYDKKIYECVGEILQNATLVKYIIQIKRIIKKGETCVGLADGILLVDTKEIYSTKNLKVGLFK